MFKFILVLLLLGGLGLLGYIRFAPSDPDEWNVDPKVTADQDLANGVRRRIDGDADTLAALDRIILATPRSELLAGSVADGRITYITRTKWMGYPDYTTLQLNDGMIELWARSRFGKSDMGVNRARVEGWLQELAQARGE